MTDSLYKFTDEAEAIALLPDYRTTFTNEEGEETSFWITASAGHCLDPVGILSDITPTEDPENPTITQLEGWHLNLRTWDGREIPAPDNLVTPANPRRVWA
jgi:hypothetical protein